MRRRLTYANVISTLALFIAVGGASYAVTQLPPNSVGTSQIKRHAVTSSKLANDATAAFRLHCRRGTRAVFGVCFEPNQRKAASFYVAGEKCEKAGGRLPTVSEMEAALDIPGLLPVKVTGEITGDTTWDSGGTGPEYLAAPNPPVGFSPYATNFPNRYRCVFAPSN